MVWGQRANTNWRRRGLGRERESIHSRLGERKLVPARSIHTDLLCPKPSLSEPESSSVRTSTIGLEPASQNYIVRSTKTVLFKIVLLVLFNRTSTVFTSAVFWTLRCCRWSVPPSAAARLPGVPSTPRRRSPRPCNLGTKSIRSLGGAIVLALSSGSPQIIR